MRLFIAVTPPLEIRDLLVTTHAEIQRARWVNRDQLHVTLRFIGEVDESLAATLREELRVITGAPISLRIKGTGTFGRPPRVLWCGLDPMAPLAELAAGIERVVLQLGLPEADHAFTPHLTLARFKSSPPVMIRSYLEANEALESPLFSITEFTLFSSTLSPEGATHTPLEVYPLGART